MIGLDFGCYGKLAYCGDFVRHGVDIRTRRLLDACVSACSESAGGLSLAATAPVCVALRLEPDVRSVGVLFASADSVGRDFPLAVLAEVDETAFDGEAACLGATMLCAVSPVLAAWSRAAPADAPALNRFLDDCVMTVDTDVAEAEAVALLDVQLQGRFWTDAFGADDETCRMRALGGLLALSRDHRGLVGFRAVNGQAHLLFWLLCTWLRRGRGELPSVVVLHPALGRQEPVLYLGWGAVDVRELAAALWPGVWAGRSVPVLPDAADEPDLPPALQEVLASPELSLRQVIYEVANA
ncbi:MAG: type VI secretion system-associated protein TagF [Planctomycetota bacterium]